jgi:hypothetical protein
MKKLIAIVLAVSLLASLVGVTGLAFAGIGKDIKDMGDNGRHFQINIIGACHEKDGDFDNPRRGTVFVKLNRQGSIVTQINFEPNTADPNKFAVLDGNGWDDGEVTIAVPYDLEGTLSYNVYAIPLGKPNGKVTVDATVVFDDDTTGALLASHYELFRNNGKPITYDISNIFRASGWIDENDNDVQDAGDTTFNNVWVFNVPTLVDYYWTYDNEKCKLLQVRFYETVSGSWGVVS